MAFIARRLVFYLVAAWSALTINFFLPRMMPGNPAQLLFARFQNLPPAALSAIEAEFGIGHAGSLWQQYGTYLTDVVHGNLGVSYGEFPATVSSILASTLPWTLVLVGVATVISFALGTLLGILAAWRRGGLLDALLPGMTFFQAAPYFFLALLLIDLFGIHLGWLPTGGGASLGLVQGWNWPFVTSAVVHAILPALTIVLTSLAGWMVSMRNVMTTTIGEEYVLAGQAKGLSSRRVVMTYAARNAILPNIASFANALGFVISGVLIMEYVFSYPGIGYLLYNAVGNEDYPLMQGIFLVIALAVLAANLLADLAYLVLDPRTRRRAAH